ncbi:MAG: dTDP-4-dehydrorhamnose reductase [Acidobacteria bacterium]|nr:MAG: dTDP-4-dehydrorhamnose reductase [Acidobacteriota bacterium]
MRILLTGVSGQLGKDLLPLLSQQGEVIPVGRAECDLCSVDAIRRLVAEVRPSVIVNPAAYTAVNEAEGAPDLAFAINETAARTLAEEARNSGAMFVHYSTDYVFDGSKQGPYTEDDEPAPLNVYGASKLAGERAIAAVGGRFLVLRTSWVYGANGKNFLFTIRRLAREREELKIVDDQVGAPTSSMQLANATARLVLRYSAVPEPAFPSGLYHATAGGSVSWCEFARAIVAALGKTEVFKVRQIVAVGSSEYQTLARRPLNSVLSNDKFERTFGFRLENWEWGLAEIVREINFRENA